MTTVLARFEEIMSGIGDVCLPWSTMIDDFGEI